MVAERSTILVVEDEAPIVALVTSIVEPLGCTVRHAPDGPNALRLLSEETFDLVLLDVILPGVNGFKICRQIRAREATRHTPVIFVTAAGDARNMKRGFAAGADDFIAKPFNVDLLFAKVRVALRTSRLQRQMGQTQSFLQGVVSSLASGLLVTDDDGVIKHLNRQATEILHCRPEDVLGRQLADALPGLEGLARPTPDTEPRALQVERRGMPVMLGYTSSLLLDGDGRAGGTVTVFREISARGAVPNGHLNSGPRTPSPDLTPTPSPRPLGSEETDLARLLATFAHEVANPLAGIQAAAQMLERPRIDEPSRRRLARAIVEESSRIRVLAEQHLRAARPPMRLGAVHPAKLCRDLLELQLLTVSRSHDLVMDLDEQTPTLQADADRLKQAVLNLVKNALEATPAGGRVVVRCRGDGNSTVLIDVEDTGTGIAPHLTPRLLEGGVTSKAQGHGLGLVVTRRIVEEHGGSMTVQSSGAGTTFTLRLPAHR
jgi:DNA-binding response OmpR family regulator